MTTTEIATRPAASAPPNDCAFEPIRIPGAIQPHGLLLGLDPDTLAVRQVSTNIGELGLAPDAWLGLALHATPLGPAVHAAVMAARGQLGEVRTPLLIGQHAGQGRRDAMLLHRSRAMLLLELEPSSPVHGTPATASDSSSDFSVVYPLVRSFVASLQGCDDIASMCRLAVKELRRLTGFTRTLVYNFDHEGHGHVLAEDVAPGSGWDPLQHHVFPASDIPAQARELYRVNHVRLIASASYQPVPLLPPNAPDGEPTDLSFAVLRSVSPVHLEYMRNMGTMASMSVSLLVKGQLWGLISCHDLQPRQVPYEVRTACEHVGQILSLQIEAKEEHANSDDHSRLRHLIVSLLAQLPETDASLRQLLDVPRTLLQFGAASGAAVLHRDDCWSIGHVPEPRQLRALGEWVLERGEDIVATDRLGEVWPEGRALAGSASGVLAVSVSRVHRHLVLWFRSEVVQAIQWAGEPRKPVDPVTGRLHPRHSFATWREEVKGRSLPWRKSELAGAAELRQALVEVVLKRAEEMAALASELGVANKELEAFSYSVSHDLRAPIRHISAFADILREHDADRLSEGGQRYLSHIRTAAQFAGVLVDALLEFARMGRSPVNKVSLKLEPLVQRVIDELKVEQGTRRVEWHVDAAVTLLADHVLLHTALRNLLGNALKYTARAEVARIRVEARIDDGEHVITIADNGVGFDMDYAGKLFGVFQRLHAVEEFEGTGIGLANVRRIVERHGGRVAAEARVGEGARFTIRLPIDAVTAAREATI